ncbi:universal stress protein [Flavobacteriaceae bacterium F89]|uniref:Universal stress protein n=1 Tax=Cerina litoralis TaxID=2874477 RepID=A0AAE3EWR5_9FLAO|nr:universal stress protein [Cerina litoralis]MCG2461764.1 universal stress protein [Cerina litoralis]
MDKRILLPTDFSKTARNAIRYALDLYADRKCSFHFLNVYQVDSYAITGSTYRPEEGQRSYEIEKRKSEERLEQLMKDLRPYSNIDKHTFHSITTYNSLLEAAKEVIAQKDIDIVVMGTKGITGSRTAIFGTNAINLMENVTECPVLAIPENATFGDPKEIVFPTDYKIPFKRRELKYLVNIAKKYGAYIRVLHIKRSKYPKPPQQRNQGLLKDLFKDVGHSFHELEGISVHTGINAFIDSRGSDMVAFINQKRGFFTKILSRSLAKELGCYSKVPVLVLKNRI